MYQIYEQRPKTGTREPGPLSERANLQRAYGRYEQTLRDELLLSSGPGTETGREPRRGVVAASNALLL